MEKILQTICQKTNFDHKTYQIEYNQHDDFIISLHCCSLVNKWNPHTQELIKSYSPNILSSFSSFQFVKYRKLILVVNPTQLVLLDYNLKETNNFSFESTKLKFKNNYHVSDRRLYIQVNSSIYIFSLNNLRLLKIHDVVQNNEGVNELNQQLQQRVQRDDETVLFDIYGNIVVYHDGKQLQILPDQISYGKEDMETEIERKLLRINRQKIFESEISSFYFYSSSNLLIVTNSRKTYFLDLVDYSVFDVQHGDCVQVVKHQSENIFYWKTKNNQHFLTFLDYKVSRKLENPQQSLRLGFVFNCQKKVAYFMDNKSLKKLYCNIINLNPDLREMVQHRNGYIVHNFYTLIKHCFRQRMINNDEIISLQKSGVLNADQLYYYYLLMEQQQSLEVADLIQFY